MKPVKIGDLTIEYPVGLAPMAGFTDHTFRSICKEMGAGLLYTEMVSAKAITYRNRNTNDLMDMTKEEAPVALQLFGNEPETLSEAIKIIEEKPCDIIDLNMGCPVPKVVKNGEGSALMKEPLLAEKVFKAMVSASSKPVTIKIRSGFNEECINAPEIARIAEECGIAAIAVHARTREQYYSGRADWSVIAEVKEAVSIPVFGNGDICDAASAAAMLSQTGCFSRIHTDMSLSRHMLRITLIMTAGLTR